MSRLTKSFVSLGGALVFCGLAWFAYEVHRAWHKFAIEDRVHHTFFPVVTALYNFQEESGTPATNLAQLTPRHLSVIPSSPYADSLDYHILSDGTNWEISIYSRALDTPRAYVHRSSGEFTADERSQEIASFHTWTVLRK